MDKKTAIDWNNLGFSYMKTDYRYISHYKDGKWDEGKLVTDNKLSISEASTALHYGQQCFEGLKAYRTKDGKIQLFRVDENAKRMNKSCDKLLMPEIPVEKFIDACMQVVKANERFVPPYGTGATLYIRPFMIGVGDNIGVKSAPEFIFSVFCLPVGAYFKGGMKPVNFMIADYDRAAPKGTGAAKVGGNYAASLKAHEIAAKKGFADCIYLDPATHTKIEEVGAANFFGITKKGEFVTPYSESILPSITKYSLMQIAKDYLKMPVSERDVLIDNLDEFAEAGACGTAAVITPIGGIEYKNKLHVFYSETEVGPTTKKLYDLLSGMQFGDVDAPEGWIFEVK
ncbi:branched-chain amino acid aminotransferase [Clostridium perfringens]|uniref:branched-chain amino acid aminotransferase n=1 Tax=Clostridium perfringens TaxID=1502 RepID=UPI0028E1435E|nr:branched-chain amino acid aminotransferase [Clostridium perfringens]EGT5620335.1 branched-chain amino acid aminotransferase [Clostridium perfringens]EHK2440744.1 branched-chain amino acid aminotransferase [Clostridium perfringens]MDT9335699.1 branched-chain amino acid aminotransferase [Clostridium perfringens]MDT9343456.1 branched-chain amino acid aminotransferase [Clostridium perfringens]MDT9346637.1 branched-chain amino acid aminotransferase [Clostridium perfringens]